MHLCAQRHQLSVPGIELFGKCLETETAFTGILQEPLLLFDYAVITGQRLKIRRVQREGAAVEEIAAGFRTTADDFQLISREADRVKLCCITDQWLSFTVDEGLFRVAVKLDS